MKINRLRATSAAALAVVCVSMGSPAAEAHGQGVLTIEGTAHLEAFPCPPPPPFGTGPCEGAFEGTASGPLGGVHEGVEWTALLSGATVTAEFLHAEIPIADGCSQGVAQGNVTITASVADGQVFGTYHDGALPKNVGGVTIQAQFHLNRIGTVLMIVLEAGTVQLDVIGGGLVTVASVIGTAAGVLDPSDLPLEACVEGATEGPAADVTVLATAALEQLGVD